jgi:hypothetical protein
MTPSSPVPACTCSRLEHCLDQINQALAPDGCLVVNDMSARAVPMAEPSAASSTTCVRLPDRYPENAGGPDAAQTGFVPHSRELMSEVDPSEAIRSDEIIPLCLERFDLLERKDYGGTLLQMLLHTSPATLKSTTKKTSDHQPVDLLRGTAD